MSGCSEPLCPADHDAMTDEDVIQHWIATDRTVRQQKGTACRQRPRSPASIRASIARIACGLRPTRFAIAYADTPPS